jgi:nicotinic acid mononucleotide adenylyltransferase
LKNTSVFVISGVWEPVSATDIRNALAPGGRADGHLPAAVAEYLKKTGLYAELKLVKET